MKRLVMLVAFGVLAIVLVGPSFAQIPARGFSVLLCVAEGAGSGPGNAQVSFEIVPGTDVQIDGDIRQVDVKIHHGESSSDHTVVYEDDGNQHLNCGDAILSVD